MDIPHWSGFPIQPVLLDYVQTTCPSHDRQKGLHVVFRM